MRYKKTNCLDDPPSLKRNFLFLVCCCLFHFLQPWAQHIMMMVNSQRRRKKWKKKTSWIIVPRKRGSGERARAPKNRGTCLCFSSTAGVNGPLRLFLLRFSFFFFSFPGLNVVGWGGSPAVLGTHNNHGNEERDVLFCERVAWNNRGSSSHIIICPAGLRKSQQETSQREKKNGKNVDALHNQRTD